MQRTFQHWIATKWLEICQDNFCIKFSALDVDFSSLSPDTLSSRRWASNMATSVKVVILPLLACVAWKRLQIGTDMLLIIISNSEKLFIGVNVDDWMTLKLQNRRFLVIFWRFPAASDILRVNCAKMAEDGPGKSAYDIFFITEHTFLRI